MTASVLTVQVGFDGDSQTVTTWTNIEDYVTQISFGYGRQDPGDMWSGNKAVLELKDLNRLFDPLNTSSPHNGDLVAGKQVRIEVHEDSVLVRRWRGFVSQWSPQWAQGGAASRTMLTCYDEIASMNDHLMKLRAADLISDRLNSAPGFWYSFDTEFVDGKVVRDLSGRGFDGQGREYYNNPSTTPIVLNGTNNAVDFQGTDTLEPTLNRRTLLDYPGFAFLADLKIRAQTGVSGSTERWRIFEDRSFGNGRSAWIFYLEETRAGNATSSSNTMKLHLHIHAAAAGTSVAFPVESFAWNVGTRGDWLNKRRIVGLGMDASDRSLFWAIPPSVGDTIGGNTSDTITSTRASFTLEDTASQWRGQAGVADFVTGITSYTSNFELFTMIQVLSPVPADWVESIAEICADSGLGVDDATIDRDEVISNLNFPTPTMDVDITNEVNLHPGESSLSTTRWKSVLEFFQTIALMQRGALFQTTDGRMRLRDFNGRDLTASFLFSDIPGGFSHGRWKEGTQKVLTDDSEVINDATVLLPGSIPLRDTDDPSILTHGRRQRSWRLPFRDRSDATTWLSGMLTLYKDADPRIHVVIEPDAYTLGWDHMKQVSVDSAVQFKFTPLGVGSEVTLNQRVEGEQWTYSANSDRWRVTLYSAPFRG